MSAHREITPLAGAVLRPADPDRPWDISASEDGSASTSLRSLCMVIPVGNNPDDAYIRLHELGHVRFSPIETPVDHVDAFQRLEEIRINELIGDRFRATATEELLAGAHLRERLLLRVLESRLSKRRNALNLLEVGDEAAPWNAKDDLGLEDFEAKAIAETIRQTKALAASHPTAIPSAAPGDANEGNRYVWMAMRRLAAIFDRVFPRYPNEDPTLLPPMPELRLKPRQAPTDAQLLEYLDDLSTWEMENTRRQHRPFNVPLFADMEEDSWGDMTIERPHLGVRAGTTRLLAPRPSDMGISVKRIHRLLTDQMVFQTKVRYKGGTLLLDCSGSMTLRPDDIEGLLRLAPAATIAGYAGDSVRGDRGWLRIVARNGMRAANDQLEFPGYDNLVDGPALRWLATQPKPRFWISDELATGRGGVTRSFLVAECKSICRRYGIRNFKTIDAAIKELRLA